MPLHSKKHNQSKQRFSVPRQRMKPNTVLAVAALLIALAPALSAQSPQGWILGPEGASCDEACPHALGSDQSTCHVESINAVTSLVLFERVVAAIGISELDCPEIYEGSDIYPSVFGFYTSSPFCYHGGGRATTSCALDGFETRRFCCCGGPCSLDYIPKWLSAGVNVDAPLAHWTLDGYVCPF